MIWIILCTFLSVDMYDLQDLYDMRDFCMVWRICKNWHLDTVCIMFSRDGSV